MEERTRPDRASAPYGQACTNCVKAKCRCMRSNEDSCERCARLSKPCTTASSVRTKGVKRAASTSKRSHLEDKIEDLVDLLRTQQASSSLQVGTSTGSMLTPISSYQSPRYWGENTMEDFFLTEDELAYFRGYHLKHFPFIFLPTASTAEQLQSTRPMFCLAIKTICNKAHSVQSRLSQKCREQLAHRLLVEGEKDFDILLGITTCMVWSYYFTNGKRFLLMFAGLARSLISDLHLERPAWHPKAGPTIELGMGPALEEKHNRSTETKRILLACFTLSTIINTSFKTDNIMSWSRQLEEDCSTLDLAGETSDDRRIVAIVHISKIIARVTEVRRCLADSNEGAEHVTLHIEGLVASLNDVRTRLNENQSQHTVVVAYLFSAEISTYELIFLHKSPASSQSLSFDHKRIDYLAALLKACQNCAEYFLALDLTTSTAPTQLVFSHSIKILHRLVILRDPVWNDEMLVSSVNVPELLYRCAMAAEQANERLKARTGEDSVFTDAARDIREMIPKWLVPNRDQVSPRPDAVPNWQAEQEHSLAIDIFSEEFWMDQPFTF